MPVNQPFGPGVLYVIPMRLIRARVMKYRSIKDTGWFDVERTKTILVGPN